MSTNKKSTEIPETNLRRSTRSTRGSLKPVVDLVKLEQETEEQETKEVKKETNAGVKKETKTRAKKQTAKNKKEVVEIKDELDSDDCNQKAEQEISTATAAGDADDDDDDDEEVEIDNDDDEDFEEPKSRRGTSRGKTTASAKKTKVKNGTTKEVKAVKGKQVKKETKKQEDQDDVEIYYELNEKEMNEVNDAFDMNCSEDGEEQLSSDDLKTAIRALGFEPRVDEIKKLIEKFGSRNGTVNRNGFHKIMAFKMGSTPGTNDNISNDEISRVFNLLDLDKTGSITLDNLKSISKELNEDITDEELHEMIAEADLDGDFMINKQEFYNIMKKTSLY